MNIPNITLPENIKPRDGRFGAGPSKIPFDHISRLSDYTPHIIGTSHRQKPVKNLVEKIRTGLAELFHLPDDYQVILGNGGATAFWDAAATSLIHHKSLHMTYGEFSSKFASVVSEAPWLSAPEILSAPAGEGLNPAEITPENVQEIDTLAWAHNETSTGVCVPVLRPEVTPSGALICIDATSAAGGMPVDINHTDVYYFSPQKSFASDGGIWFAIMSPAAIERIQKIHEEKSRWIPQSLSLTTAIDNSLKNQTYNTPALCTLLLMHEQLAWLLSQGGLTAASARSQDSSSRIYSWAEKSDFAYPFVTNPQYRSSVITTINFNDSIDAAHIAAILRKNNIVDTEPYRKLGKNQLRIATFPAIDPDDISALTHCIDYICSLL